MTHLGLTDKIKINIEPHFLLNQSEIKKHCCRNEMKLKDSIFFNKTITRANKRKNSLSPIVRIKQYVTVHVLTPRKLQVEILWISFVPLFLQPNKSKSNMCIFFTQYSTLQYNTLRCKTLRCNTLWCNTTYSVLLMILLLLTKTHNCISTKYTC